MCGEKDIVAPLYWWKEGSPPRVRGKGSIITLSVGSAGITPACAGKRTFFVAFRVLRQDHPRVCGEKDLQCFLIGFETGSPPRVRGKDYREDASRIRTGITPACAGKSGLGRELPTHDQDHPRVCGEKLSGAFFSLSRLGSPPRVRGKD